MIEPGARVLDIGCGDGALLGLFARHKGVDGRGIELSQSGVNACVGHGLSVIQGDADRDLDAYPDGAFDVVVLSQTLQATRAPRRVLEALVRIGRRAIVSFPNFGFWRIRLGLAVARPDAGVRSVASPLVRNSEHSSVHDPRFCRAVRRTRHQDRTRRHARPPWPALFTRSAWQPRQPAGRAGRVRPLRSLREDCDAEPKGRTLRGAHRPCVAGA